MRRSRSPAPASARGRRFRTERDTLGSVRVPLDAPWGAQTARAIANFPVSGRSADAALIRAYLLVKRACAVANRRCGALGARECGLITRAIDRLLPLEPRWAGLFPVDIFQAGAGTSQNMNLNEVIANLANGLRGHPAGSHAPIHPNDHVNRSQSTNDTYPTALRLALLDRSRELTGELSMLADSFGKKGEEWARLPKAARTHLQDAVPMRLGSEARAYGATIRRACRWIEHSRDALRELGLGGSAAGTALNVPAGFRERTIRELARTTGEALFPAPDLHEAMQSQAALGHYSGSLRLLALELTRICNDLRLLSSGPLTGFGEIEPPAVQAGSSIMPGKVNPSILEMANQVWFAVLGHDQSVAFALQAGQLELNVMMPLMAASLLEGTRIAGRAARILRTRCIDGLRANAPRLRRHFESTPQAATALSPRLGYAATAELVRESLRAGRPVAELARERGLLTDEELSVLLDPEKLVGAA